MERRRSLIASQEDATSPRDNTTPSAPRGQPNNAWARARLVTLLVLGATLVAVSLWAGERGDPREATTADEPAVALAPDFADGTLQGVQREPDGSLVLSDAAAVPPDERPRAYADRAAFGWYTSPTLQLAQPASRVTASLTADLPQDAEAVLEVRGQSADGRWTPWLEIESDGAPAELDRPATALSYRLTLLGEGPGDAGPRVRGVRFGLRAERWRLAAAGPAPQASPFAATAAGAGAAPPLAPTAVPPTLRVWATREGLVGARTANGHVIEPSDRFVALPSRRVLNQLGGYDYTVTIHYKGRSATVPVWDIGPWNIRDNYWDPSRELFADLQRWMPQAQAAFFANHNQGRDQFGRFITLPTALDIADGTFWDDLGMTANDWVEVTFNWLDGPSPAWVQPVTVVPKPTPTPVPKPKAASYNGATVPAPRQYLPVVLRGFEGWSTTVIVQNPNGVAVSGSIELYNRDGTAQASQSFALPPFGKGSFPVASFDNMPGRFVGAGVVNANQPVAVLVHEDRPDMDRMSYPAQPSGSATLYAPLAIKDLNGWDTIIHVQNVDGAPAQVEIAYYSTTGNGRTWTDTATIPPLGSRAFSQFQHPQLPAGFVGSAVIRATNGSQLVAVVNEVKTEGAAVSYVPTAGGAATSLAPFVLRNYQGWSTGLQVQNVGSAPTTAVVTYTRLNGPGTWTESAPVGPGAAAVFYQPANQQLPDNFMGVASVASADGTPLLVLANIMNPQSTAAMNYLASGFSGPTLSMPYVTRNSDGWSTGILVYNPNSAPVTARVTYYDAAGNQVAREEEPLPPGGTRSFYQQRLAALPDGFAGSALVQSQGGQPLVAVASEVYSP
ncbi:MAG TPA: hypothetical protein VFE37_11555 [Chloroflexota bacterium]|nr:hypothetical protein [Chloroflexota bacterium]